LPAVTEHGRPLVFRERGPAEEFAPDAAGLPAPPAPSTERTPDLILVPLLAFDRRGGRLGQGGGFYDRTIAALRAAGPVTGVGLAYAGQEVDRVPTDDRDALLDGILTETAY